MSHPRYSGDAITRRGHELYERIRPQVETDENIGKLISIDIESGDYEVGDDILRTAKQVLARHPGAAVWTGRIGYDAVVSLGGTLTRTAP